MNVEELRYTNNFWRVSASKRAERNPCIRARVGKYLMGVPAGISSVQDNV